MEKKEPLISVIIPVYKAERYLMDCIDSVRNQTYRNLEIILVEDGSPDRCGALCDEAAKRDGRIRVIHKENGGQASARNAALNIMTGDYVGFVDSDDWIEPNMYEHLYRLLLETDAQIAACGTQLDHLNGTHSYFNPNYPGESQVKKYTKMEALSESLDNARITYSLCDKLFLRDIFGNIRMIEGMIYEDMEIIPRCLEGATCIAYDPTPLYHYRLTEESTIRGTFSKRRFAEADVSERKVEEYQRRYPSLYNKAFARHIAISLQLIHDSRKSKECAERRKEMITEIRSELSQSVIAELDRNERIKLTLLRTSEFAFEFVMTLNDLRKRR